MKIILQCITNRSTNERKPNYCPWEKRYCANIDTRLYNVGLYSILRSITLNITLVVFSSFHADSGTSSNALKKFSIHHNEYDTTKIEHMK